MHKTINYNSKQSGQVVIILLLLALVALGVGLAVTQRSVSNLTSSTQSDESARAFSAAEAGIDKAIASDAGTGTVTIDEGVLNNQSKADVSVIKNLPTTGQAIEYPSIGRETTAHFWLINPATLAPASAYPSGGKLCIYMGRSSDSYGTSSSDADKVPALEVLLVTQNASGYHGYRSYIDPDSGRTQNGFYHLPQPVDTLNCGNSANTVLGQNRTFKYSYLLNLPVGETPILLRSRFLYISGRLPVAVKPMGGNSLPSQVDLYTSHGTSGQSSKVLQVLREAYVSSPLLDYAIFSVQSIEKNTP